MDPHFQELHCKDEEGIQSRKRRNRPPSPPTHVCLPPHSFNNLFPLALPPAWGWACGERCKFIESLKKAVWSCPEVPQAVSQAKGKESPRQVESVPALLPSHPSREHRRGWGDGGVWTPFESPLHTSRIKLLGSTCYSPDPAPTDRGSAATWCFSEASRQTTQGTTGFCFGPHPLFLSHLGVI